MLRFVDTNILLHSISRRPSDKRKRQRAIDLLTGQDLALSVQVLQEFYVQATRVTRDDALSHDVAVGFMKAWSRFPVQEISLEIVNAALIICRRHQLSYWDSSIMAAAQALGCSELLTEDMNHGQRVGLVKIVNPFRE